MFLVLFLCSLFISSVVLVDPVCSNTPFNPPADPSVLTWYPNDFTGTTPPRFPNEFNCLYKINVPKGWSANVKLTMNMSVPIDFAVSVLVTDQNQFSQSVYGASGENFFFVSPGGNIRLNTREQNITFGFSVKWYKNEAVFNPSYGSVSIASSQPLVFWAYHQYPYQIKAETRVSLVVTPPNDDNYVQYLRSLMIYDGPDWNSPCLGNALQVVHSQRQLVSSGQYMTFSQLPPYNPTGRTMIVFQDYQNSKNIVQYQGLAFQTLSEGGAINMDGSLGLSAITTVTDGITSGAEYLTNLSGSGKLDVYIGSKTSSKTNLITSYNLNDTSSYLPQEFLGYVRTYVLTGTNANLRFNRTSATWSNSSPAGRKGFFASRYYKSGMPSPYQDVYDFVKAPTNQRVTFSFNIREADFVGNTTLKISVYNGGKSTYEQTFTSSNRPTLNKAVSAFGDDFSVNYKTYGYSTNGYYLDFELSSSSHTFKLLTIVSFCILFFAR